MLYFYTLIAIVFLTLLFIGGLSAAPYVPTKKKQLQLLLKNINIQPGQTVYDLGCGTGSVLLPLARAFPEANFIGIELAPIPWLIAKIKSFKLKNAKITLRNIFKVELKDSDVIFIFLLEDSYPKLIKKLSREVKDDCLIITEAWPLRDIEPTKLVKEKDLLGLYFYRGEQLREATKNSEIPDPAFDESTADRQVRNDVKGVGAQLNQPQSGPIGTKKPEL